MSDSVTRNPDAFAHEVAEMEGLMQPCVRCGRILLDYRGGQSDGGFTPQGFPPGPITTRGNKTSVGRDDDAVECLAVMS